MDIRELLRRLWDDYTNLNPQAERIHELLRQRGETIRNDHIAFRTWDDPRVGVETIARPFVEAGYEPKGEYRFPEKKVFARHYEHPDEDLPRVFVSELNVDQFSEAFQTLTRRLIDRVPGDAPERPDFPVSGRHWDIAYTDYEKLREESEYGAWLAAFGFRANHFTISVNALESFDDLARLNAFLKDRGFELNTAGGEIKGSPDVLLEQSSTLAPEVEVAFSDGPHRIPGCYYEFALRHRDKDGHLFSGFIAASAEKIFQSTDQRS